MRYCLTGILLIIIGFASSAKNLNQQADTARWAISATRLNTPSSESHPLLSIDGQTMYFVRRDHEMNVGQKNLGDIWVAYRDSAGVWSNTVNAGVPINNENDNKVVGISLNAASIYLTGSEASTIFISHNQERSWSIPRPIAINQLENQASELNAYVSFDESFIILALQNEQSIGKRDLFVSIKNQYGNWDTPISLGSQINSVADEANVFLAADNRTLYFCTDGRQGLGGQDWYMTRRLDDTWQSWQTPRNLGNTVNTNQDDLYFSVNSELQECYTTQYRNAGDISLVSLDDKDMLPTKTVLIYGKVQTSDGSPVQTTVDIYQLNHQEPSQTVYSRQDGSFLVLLTEDARVGFVANDKDKISSMAYVNFLAQPLKYLDRDSTFKQISDKDSLHLFNFERLQIRVGQLNNLITALDKNRNYTKSISYEQLEKFIAKQNNFELNRALTNQYKLYNQKYGKSSSRSNNNAQATDFKAIEEFSNNPNIEENYPKDKITIDWIDWMMRQFGLNQADSSGTQQGTLIAKNTHDAIVGNNTLDIDDLRAIDNIRDLQGVNQVNIPEFEVVIASAKKKMVRLYARNVENSLEQKLIENWDNWNALYFTPEEIRILRNKIGDVRDNVQRLFKRKNLFNERTDSTYADILNEDEKEIEKVLKITFFLGIQDFIRDSLARDIDYEMRFQLHETLRQSFLKAFETERNYQAKKTAIVRGDSPNTHWSNRASAEERNVYPKLTLYPMNSGSTVPLQGIFFEPSSAVLSSASLAELHRIKKIMEDNPFKSIELLAYTHSHMTNKQADWLTQERLNNIRNTLVDLGVNELNIKILPLGKAIPMVLNDTIEGRLKNQRIELRFKSK